MSEPPADIETLARDVRIYVFREAAASGQVPQAPQLGRALGRLEPAALIVPRATPTVLRE